MRKWYRRLATLSFCLLLPLLGSWLWLSTTSGPAHAVRGLVAFLWHSDFRYYTYLFPQAVVAGELEEDFLRDFPGQQLIPHLNLPGKGASVIQYFMAIKGSLDRYHLTFGTYPDPAHLPPLSEDNTVFWPSLEEAHCRYLRLTPATFLLGWAGPDGVFEDTEAVLAQFRKPYGLLRLGDDWWVRCMYFDFATYRQNYPKLAREVTLEPDQIRIVWPLVERVLKAKGVEWFQVQGGETQVDWLSVLQHPITLLLLGGLTVSILCLLITREQPIDITREIEGHL